MTSLYAPTRRKTRSENGRHSRKPDKDIVRLKLSRFRTGEKAPSLHRNIEKPLRLSRRESINIILFSNLSNSTVKRRTVIHFDIGRL